MLGMTKGILFKAEPCGLIVMSVGIAYLIIKNRKNGQAWLRATFGKRVVEGFVATFLGWPMIVSGFLMCFPDLWSDLWNFALCVVVYAIWYFIFRSKNDIPKNDENQKKANNITMP